MCEFSLSLVQIRLLAKFQFPDRTPNESRLHPSREAISILSGKYKRLTFVHSVLEHMVSYQGMKSELPVSLVGANSAFSRFSCKNTI